SLLQIRSAIHDEALFVSSLISNSASHDSSLTLSRPAKGLKFTSIAAGFVCGFLDPFLLFK
ncbi:hypothetical protein CUMW_207050, partial [Citrus unshiu]